VKIKGETLSCSTQANDTHCYGDIDRGRLGRTYVSREGVLSWQFMTYQAISGTGIFRGIAKGESKLLSDEQVPEKRAGVHTLKGRLLPIYAELMCHSLPGLESSDKFKFEANILRLKLEEAKKPLKTIGSEPLAVVSARAFTMLFGGSS
jgi:hypothetical protein